MADQDQLFTVAADLGSTDAQLNKLKTLFEDTANGISKFIGATADLDADSKRLTVTLEGISNAFNAVKESFTIGPRGGVQGLKEVTAAAEDLNSGFGVVITITKQFQAQLEELNKSVKNVQTVIQQSADAQIAAVQKVNEAEADAARKRKARTVDARKDIEKFLADQNLTIPNTSSTAEISSLNAAKNNLLKGILDATRLPGGRDKALEDTITAIRNNAIATSGPLAKLQQDVLAVLTAYDNLGKSAQAAADKAAASAQKQADKLKEANDLLQQQKLLDDQNKARQSLRDNDSRLVGSFLRTEFQPPADAAPTALAGLEIPIRRFEERAKAGKLQVVQLLDTITQFKQTGELAFGNLTSGTIVWLKQLLLADSALHKTNDETTEAIAKAEALQAIRNADSQLATTALQQQFQIPTGTSETDAASLALKFTQVADTVKSGKLQLTDFFNILNNFSQTGKLELDGLEASVQRLIISLVKAHENLTTVNTQSPFQDRVNRATTIAQSFSQAFSKPVSDVDQDTTRIDKLITELAILARDADITKQRIQELFNAARTPNGAIGLAFTAGAENAEKKIFSIIQSLLQLKQTALETNAAEFKAQREIDSNLLKISTSIKGLILTLDKSNGILKPDQFLRTQNAINTLFEKVKSGTLDIVKLQQAIADLSIGIPLTPRLPNDGGKEQAAIAQFAGAFKEVEKTGVAAGNNIFLSFSNVFRLLQVQVIHQIFGTFITDIRTSQDEAAKFSIKIAEIRTLSQQSQLSTAEWGNGLRKLSDDFGLPLLDVVKSAYDAISNQVVKGAQAFEFLRITLEFAKVTVASAADAQNLLASAIKSFGEQNLTAQKAAESLFKLIDLGRVTASELAPIFGRVAQLAAQAGLSIDELGAALATLTIQGVRPDEAFTLLNNLLLKLIKPTKDMSDLLLKLGFSSGEAALKSEGLAGIFAILNKELEAGGLSRIADLEGNIRAIRGAIATSGADPLAEFTKNLKEFKTQSEEFANAADIIKESAGNKLQKEFNEIKNIFSKDFGQEFIQSVLNLAEPFGGLANIVRNAAQLLGSLLETIKTLITPLSNFTAAFINLFPTGSIEVIKIVTAGFVAYKFAVIAAQIATTAYTAGLVAFGDGALGLIPALTTSTIATDASTAAKIKDTFASRLRTAAYGSEAAAATALSGVTAGLTLGLTALFTIYSIGQSNLDAFNASFEREIETSKKLREELELQAIERKRQTGIDTFTENSRQIFKGVNDQITEATKKAVQLLDNIHKLDSTGLKGLEQQIRNVFKEFETKKTPFEQLKELIADIDKSQKRVINLQVQGDTKQFENILAGLIDTQQTALIVAKANELRNKIIGIFNESAKLNIIGPENVDDVRKQFEEINKIVTSQLDKLGNSIKSQQKLIADLKNKADTKDFENSLSGKSVPQQTQLTFQRVDLLRQQAFDLFRKGDLEEARGKFDEIDKLLAKIAEKQKSFRDKTVKLGIGTDAPLTADSRIKQNEQDRLALEQGRLSQLKQQHNQIAQEQANNTKDQIEFEKSLQNQQQTRIQQAIDAERELIALNKARQEFAQAESKLNAANAKALKDESDARSKINTNTQSIDEQLKNQSDKITGTTFFGSIVDGGRTTAKKAKEDLDNLRELAAKIKLDPSQANIDEFKQKLAEARLDLERLNAVRNAGSVSSAVATQEELDKLAQIVTDNKEFQKTLEGINQFYNNQLKQVNEIAIARDKAAQAEKDVAAAIEAQNQARAALPQSGGATDNGTVGGGGDFGVSTAATQLNDTIDSLKAAFHDLTDAIRDVAQNINPQVPRRALGGPLGTDDTLFWGSKDEFVVNAQSSRRFAPQLRSMNMGFMPKFNSTSSSNAVNVGDIHLNIQGNQSSNDMVREIGSKLRREIRRGTLKLN